MTIRLQNLVPGVILTTGQVTEYTAPTNVNAKINNATVTNYGNVSANLSVWLVPQGGAVGNATIIIDAQAIAALQVYNCPELVGKNILSGGTLVAQASGNTTLAMNVAGLEMF